MRAITAALIATTVLSAQTPPARLEFEVASVKPSAPLNQSVNIGVHIDGARVSCTSLSLKDYLRMAYDVKDFQIQAPDWMASQRYDIAATIPQGAPRDKLREMIQSLLADRFHLAFHRESKEFPVYGLVVGKEGSKLKESAPDPDATTPKTAVNVAVSGGRGGTSINLGNGSVFAFGNNKIEGTKLTMLAFADTLARFVDRPVVDMTGLKGNYDFTIEMSPEDFRGMNIRAAITAGVSLPPEVVKQALEGGTGDSLFSAIQSLGLRLERRKAPLEVLVVDRADKMPTEN